jgi:hypothetical protein
LKIYQKKEEGRSNREEATGKKQQGSQEGRHYKDSKTPTRMK